MAKKSITFEIGDKINYKFHMNLTVITKDYEHYVLETEEGRMIRIWTCLVDRQEKKVEEYC